MGRKLIIDGNAVYEIDEDCMLKRRVDKDRNGGEKRENETEMKNKSQPGISSAQKTK